MPRYTLRQLYAIAEFERIQAMRDPLAIDEFDVVMTMGNMSLLYCDEKR